MEIPKFNPQFYEYSTPIDLERLHKQIDYNQARNDEAIKTKTDLEIQLANLDLNPAEDGYKKELANEIESELENNSISGNYAGALNALVKAKGRMFSNPVLLGKLRNQREYRQFVDNVNNNSAINSADKQHIIDENPYSSNIKFDANGSPIGTDEFKPTPYYNSVDYFDFIKKAMDIVKVQTGGGTSIRWIDKDGNISNTFDPQGYGEYMTTTGNWQRLPKSKILKAALDVINSNEENRKSIEQDYRFRVKEGKAMDVNGIAVPINDYIISRLKGLAEDAEVNNYTSSSHVGDGVKYLINGVHSLSKSGRTSSGGLNNFMPSLNTNRTNAGASYNLSLNLNNWYSTNKENIKNQLNELYHNATGNYIKRGPGGVLVWDDANLDNATKFKMNQLYDSYLIAEKSYARWISGFGGKDVNRDAILDFNAFTSGEPLVVRRGEGKKSIMNSVFNSLVELGGGQNIIKNKLRIVNQDLINDLSKNENQGVRDYLTKTIGATLKGNYIDIPLKYYKKAALPLYFLSNHITPSASIQTINENGEVVRGTKDNRGLINKFRTNLDLMGNIRNEALKKIPANYRALTFSSAGYDVEDLKEWAISSGDPNISTSEQKAISEAYKKSFKGAFNSSTINNAKMYEIINGVASDIENDEKENTVNTIKSALNKGKYNVNVVLKPIDGDDLNPELYYHISFNSGTDSNPVSKEYYIKANDVVNQPENIYNAFMNSPEVVYSNKLHKSALTGQPYMLTGTTSNPSLGSIVIAPTNKVNEYTIMDSATKNKVKVNAAQAMDFMYLFDLYNSAREESLTKNIPFGDIDEGAEPIIKLVSSLKRITENEAKELILQDLKN